MVLFLEVCLGSFAKLGHGLSAPLQCMAVGDDWTLFWQQRRRSAKHSWQYSINNVTHGSRTWHVKPQPFSRSPAATSKIQILSEDHFAVSVLGLARLERHRLCLL
jgi:hypothetical protein